MSELDEVLDYISGAAEKVLNQSIEVKDSPSVVLANLIRVQTIKLEGGGAGIRSVKSAIYRRVLH